jgi:hypothetical protein
MAGYCGRAGIHEMQRLLLRDADLAMKPLRLSGAEKVAADLAMSEKVIKAAPPQV